MCCLAYEENFYKLQSDILPEVGVILENDGEKFEVTRTDIFNDAFTIKDENGNEKSLGIDEYVDYKVVGKIEKEKPEIQYDENLDDTQEDINNVLGTCE